MNPITHILLNPWFSSENDQSCTLVYSGDDIDNCIKHFWTELSRKNFILDDSYNMRNFPMSIYDKQLEKIRTFMLSTGMYQQSMRLMYDELPYRNVDNYRGFDNYYDRIMGQFYVNLDLSNVNMMKDRYIMFPKFRRNMLIKY